MISKVPSNPNHSVVILESIEKSACVNMQAQLLCRLDGSLLFITAKR